MQVQAVVLHNNQWWLGQYNESSVTSANRLVDVEILETNQLVRDKVKNQDVFPLDSGVANYARRGPQSELSVSKLLARSGYGKINITLPTKLAPLVKRYDRLYDFKALMPQVQDDDALEQIIEYLPSSDSVNINSGAWCQLHLSYSRNLPCKIDSVSGSSLTVYVESPPANTKLFLQRLPTTVAQEFTLALTARANIESLSGWRFKSIGRLTLGASSLTALDWHPLGGASIDTLRLNCPQLPSLRGLQNVAVKQLNLSKVGTSESKLFSFDGLPKIDRLSFISENIRKAPINVLSMLLLKHPPKTVDGHYHEDEINAALSAINMAPKHLRTLTVRQEMLKLKRVLPPKWLTMRT